MMTWADRLRKAIEDSGMSRYAVARDAGLSYSIVHGFVNGTRGLTLDNAERIARVVGLELRPVRQKKRRK